MPIIKEGYSAITNGFKIGMEIEGFNCGYFGRDCYGIKRVEYIGPDYIVFRHLVDYDGNGIEGDVSLIQGSKIQKLWECIQREEVFDKHR